MNMVGQMIAQKGEDKKGRCGNEENNGYDWI